MQGRACRSEAERDEGGGERDGRRGEQPERTFRRPHEELARERLGRPVRELQPAVDCLRPSAEARRTTCDRRRWASERSVAQAAARIASARIVPVCATNAVTTGKAPQASANPRSVWTRPPKSARLYAGTSTTPAATSGRIQSVRSRATTIADRGRGGDRRDGQARRARGRGWTSPAVARRARRARARRRPSPARTQRP